MPRKVSKSAILVIVTVMTLTGCESESPAPPVPFTRDMAETVLTDVVTGVSKDGLAGFCTKFARGEAPCAEEFQDGLRRCLLPGDRPTIVRARHLPATDSEQESWQLSLQGKTLDGQKYISDFLVSRSPGGRPEAEIGVYWTGLGQGRDMDEPSSKTIVPQSACPQ